MRYWYCLLWYWICVNGPLLDYSYYTTFTSFSLSISIHILYPFHFFVLSKGKMEPIDVSIQKRMGNKKVSEFLLLYSSIYFCFHFHIHLFTYLFYLFYKKLKWAVWYIIKQNRILNCLYPSGSKFLQNFYCC